MRHLGAVKIKRTTWQAFAAEDGVIELMRATGHIIQKADKSGVLYSSYGEDSERIVTHVKVGPAWKEELEKIVLKRTKKVVQYNPYKDPAQMQIE